MATEDRNALLAVLAVRKGWAQPAEVLAAQVALSVHPDQDLASELAESGALSHEKARELELLAEKTLAAHGGDVARAIAEHGGLDQLSEATGPLAPVKPDGFVDDEPTIMRRSAPNDDADTLGVPPVSLDQDDDERTSVALDLSKAPPAPAPAQSLGDDDEESTKVLDWERATRKSIEKFAVEEPPPKKR